MKKGLKILAAVSGGLVGSAVVASALGSRAWNRATERDVAKLLPTSKGPGTETFSIDRLAGLPEPVARYFLFALKPGQPLIRGARIEQEAEFKTGMEAGWSPLKAVQHFSAAPPGFVWDASIRMAPLVTVRVRDSYIGGVGSMRGRAASLVPVVDQSGSPEIAAGALHRYLAEAVWIPTALLPGRGVTWEPINDKTARATLTDSGVTVSLDFEFSPNGEIIRASTPSRFRDVKGTAVPTPWFCTFRRYEEHDGVKVPMEGEVEWRLPEGPLPYWRGRIVRIEYD